MPPLIALDPLEDGLRDAGAPLPRVTGVTRFPHDIAPGVLFVDVRRDESEPATSPRDILDRGPAAILTSRPRAYPPAGVPILGCDDPVPMVGSLARRHLAQWPAPRIGITGSTGKTTTADMTADLLGGRPHILRTDPSENDEFGVPIQAFLLGPEHRFFVVEMATWRPGEIAFIADVVQPQTAVVTNVGLSHLARFGTKWDILKAKAELVRSVPRDGRVIVEGDAPYTSELEREATCRVWTFGCGSSDAAQVLRFHLQPTGTEASIRLLGRSIDIRVPRPGLHNLRNAAAALLVGSAAGVDSPLLAQRLAASSTRRPGRWFEMACSDGILVIDDSHNASPASVLAAIKCLRLYANRRTVAVFGGMAELGTSSERLHQDMLEAFLDDTDIVIAYGLAASIPPRRSGRATLVLARCRSEALQRLESQARAGDVVLFKASGHLLGSPLAQEFALSHGWEGSSG